MTARYTQRTCPWYNHRLVGTGNDNDVSDSGGDGGDNSGDDGGDGDDDHDDDEKGRMGWVGPLSTSNFQIFPSPCF